MKQTFSARVMALPHGERGRRENWLDYAEGHEDARHGAAAIAAEADALAEAARGLRVALVFALNVLHGVGAKAEEAQAMAALAAFDKAAGDAA